MFRQRLKSDSTMNEPTLLQLQCFEALVTEGSFAAAAARLNRTHPTVHAAVTALEARVGTGLLDRAGCRGSLPAEGGAFRWRGAVFRHQYDNLRRGRGRDGSWQEGAQCVGAG